MQLYRQHRKTAHRALQGLFLGFVTFYRHKYQTGTSGYNTACATLERAHAPGRPPPIPDTTAMPDAAQLSTAAYYNKVYKSASLLWIHAIQCSRSQTMQARRCQLLPSANRWQALHPAHLLRGSASPPVQGQPGGLRSGTGQQSGRTGSVWHPPPGGAVQQQGNGGRRGTLDGCRRISFWAFAR